MTDPLPKDIHTSDALVEAIADALATLPCRDFSGMRQGDHELDVLRRREAARAAIAAITTTKTGKA